MYRSVKNNIIMLCFLIILFQEYLQTLYPPLGYFDEILALFLLIYFAFNVFFAKKKVNKSSIKVSMYILILIGIGVVSNLCSDIPRSFIAIVYDIFFVFKIFIVYLGGIEFFDSISDRTKASMLRKLASLVRVIVLISFFAMILNFILPNGFSRVPGEIRYGIRSFGALFSGPAFLNMYIYDYIFILTADLAFNNVSKSKKIAFIIICNILWLSTLRSRAFSYVVLYFALVLIFIVKREPFQKLHLKLRHIILGGIAGIFISYNMILRYFFVNSREARYKLIRIAIQMTKDYVPLGAGFGTYGTNAAVLWYSNVYSKYGVSNDFGLSKVNPDYIFDNYWPSILGQFGLLGTIVMAILIFTVFKNIAVKCNDNKYYFTASIMLIICVVVSSLATSSLYSYESCGLIFISMLIVSRKGASK